MSDYKIETKEEKTKTYWCDGKAFLTLSAARSHSNMLTQRDFDSGRLERSKEIYEHMSKEFPDIAFRYSHDDCMGEFSLKAWETEFRITVSQQMHGKIYVLMETVSSECCECDEHVYDAILCEVYGTLEEASQGIRESLMGAAAELMALAGGKGGGGLEAEG